MRWDHRGFWVPSWEGFAIGAVVERLHVPWNERFFWATHAGAELDLVVVRCWTRLGFEIKRTAAPQVTPSIRIALHDLKLARLDVVHAGSHTSATGRATFARARRLGEIAIAGNRTYRLAVLEDEADGLRFELFIELSSGTPACAVGHSGHRIHLSERVH